MADHNYTKFSWGDPKGGFGGIEMATCMMGIRRATNKVKIFIPFSWLNPGITKEDVYRWIKFGNETLFPAEISEDYISHIDDIIDFPSGYSDGFLGLKIRRKDPSKTRYKQSDARECLHGILRGVFFRDGGFRISTNVYHDGDFSRIKYSGWNGFAIDHELYETGQCLQEYIESNINKPIKEPEKQEANTFVVVIDCSKLTSNHKLAALSFYRLLWSVNFKGLVKDTLRLVDTDVNFWDAFYYAMSIRDYSSYYGFISYIGWRSMSSVKADIERGDVSINTSFSCRTRGVGRPLPLTEDMSGIKDKVNNFILRSKAKNPDHAISIECITDKLKTFTLGRSYKATSTVDESKYLCLKDDRYCNRVISKKHFKEQQ